MAAEPGTEELTASDDAVLAPRKRVDGLLARPRITNNFAPRITDNFPSAGMEETAGRFTAHIAANPPRTGRAPAAR